MKSSWPANPAGTIPAFIDGAVGIGDSTAAIVYLAARYGPTPLAAEPAAANFADYLQFLHFSEASLGGLLGAALASRFFAPAEERGNWGGRFVLHLATRRSALIERQRGVPVTFFPKVAVGGMAGNSHFWRLYFSK